MLPEQKYGNNLRIVSGAVTVFANDVVLAVDTSTGPAMITLDLIPAAKWSTQYKLYVYDASNNASVNTIQINAQPGQTINGSASIIINTNGGSELIRIVGENRYISLSSNTAGGGTNGHVIANQGIALPQRPTLNFIGSGITAFDDAINNRTNVEVIGGIVALTAAAMTTLINTSQVVPTQLYRITDAQYTHGGVIVMGVTPTTITRECHSLHLNADYSNAGNYSGVSGFTTQTGIWNQFAATYNLGEVVIYNNRHYINVGAVTPGMNPTVNVTAWNLLPKTIGGGFSSNQGYIFTVDFALYDLTNNRIIRREDRLKNIVEYALIKGEVTFDNFPWGNIRFISNKILGESASIINLCNCAISFQSNTIDNSSFLMQDVDPNISGTVIGNYVNNGDVNLECNIALKVDMLQNTIFGAISIVNNSPLEITDNFIDSSSVFNVVSGLTDADPTGVNVFKIFANAIMNGFNVNCYNVNQTIKKDFLSNHFTNLGAMSIATWTGTAQFSYCNIQTAESFVINQFSSNNLQGGFESTLIDDVISTFPIVVDWADPLIYDIATETITLDLSWNYVGRFLNINSSTLGVAKIFNAPTKHPFEMVAFDLGVGSNDFRVVWTNLALATANHIIRNGSFTSFVSFVYNANMSESITLQKNGILNFQVNQKKWI